MGKRLKYEINNIQKKVDNVKNRKTIILEKKIRLNEDELNYYTKQEKLIDNNLRLIINTNPTLAALDIMQKRDLHNAILGINIKLVDLRAKKDNLTTKVIWDLQERKELLELMLLPYNYKNSHIVGSIRLSTKPYKPKKKLVVIVSFVTGLLFSIFLAFFIEFLAEAKRKRD